MSGNGLLKEVMEGRKLGKRGPGKLRIGIFKDPSKLDNMSKK